jgi:hypothetical protein
MNDTFSDQCQKMSLSFLLGSEHAGGSTSDERLIKITD